MGKRGTGFVPCTNCGGTGAVDTVEIDSKGRAKRVRRVCTTCGGRGGFHV